MLCPDGVVVPREKVDVGIEEWKKTIYVLTNMDVKCIRCSAGFKLDAENCEGAKQHILKCSGEARAEPWFVCLSCGKKEADTREVVDLERRLGHIDG